MADTGKEYSYYRDKHVLFEGDVTVFKRPKFRPDVERARATQERWQMQIKIPGQKRITKSTRTGNLGDALSIAKETYMKMRQRAEQGLPLTDMNFETFFETEWMPRAEATLSIHRVRVHRSIGARYMVGFFGGYELAEINEILLDKYWEWRWTYWTHGPGQHDDKVFYKVDRPSPATLRQEKGVLNQILKFAKRRGYINALPIIAVPSMDGKRHRHRKGRETTFFDEEDYKKLYLFLADWQHGGRHKLHRLQRKMLRFLILFLLNSGLRPNEAWQLRWKDIRPTTIRNDGRYAEIGHNSVIGSVEHIKLYIREETKTGSRHTVPNIPAKRYLDYAFKAQTEWHGKEPDPDDLVWLDYKGKVMNQSHRTFETMLKDAGLLLDREGRKRTLYSCRHTFITSRLLNGVPMEDVARNVGTDPKQIKQTYDHVMNEQKAAILTQQISDEYEDEWAANSSVPIVDHQRIKFPKTRVRDGEMRKSATPADGP